MDHPSSPAWHRLYPPTFWGLLLAVAVLSLMPGHSLPSFTASIWDKAQHAGGFAALAVLGLWSYGHRQGTGRVLLGLLAFGVAIELAQATTSWRHGDVRDVLADAVGLLIGWGIARLTNGENRPNDGNPRR